MRWLLNRPSASAIAALGLILLVGAGLRVAMMAHAPGLVVNRDSADFFLAGYQLATTGEFPLPAKRAPLYPLFVAGIVESLGPSLQAVVAVHHLLGMGTVVLAFLLGSLAFGRPAGLLAALGAALNGSLLLMEQTIVSETVFVPLLMASLVVLLLALRGGSPNEFGARRVGHVPPTEVGGMETAHAPTLSHTHAPTHPRSHALTLLVLAGLLLGLAALTRPVAQALLPLLIFAVVLQPWRWRARLLGVAVLCLGYGVVVGPWLARNHAVHGVASISSGLGDALFARTHRHDKGFQWRDRGEPPADPRQALIRQRVFELAGKYEHEVEVRGALQAELGLNDVQGDTALREAASQVIRQQPLHWAGGSLRFFGEVWRDFDKPLDVRWEMSTKRKHVDTWPEPIRPLLAAGGSRPDPDQAAVERLTELYQDYNLGAAITALFILGAVRCLSGGWRSGAAILPILVLGQLLLYVALDGPLVRYRYAVQPLITLIAAGGLTWGVGLAWRAWAVRIAGRSWPPAADVPDSAAAGGALTPTLSQRERGPAPSPRGRGLG